MPLTMNTPFVDGYKKEIAKIYNAPINGDLISNRKIQKIKGLFLCISENRNIPSKRIKEIKNEIKNELGIKKITKNLTNRWINSKSSTPVVCVKTHGEMVVNQLKNISNFVKEWRIHFVNNTNPKFLPENWSIDHE